MAEYIQIRLRRSNCVAYVKLLSDNKAKFYVPGKLDTFLTRASTGEWVLDHGNPLVQKALWNIDSKDIYSGNGVEELLNNELSALINKAMFDEDPRDTVS